MVERFLLFLLVCLSLATPRPLYAQTTVPDTALLEPTLENCIRYALRNNPTLRQIYIDQEITETVIRSNLADWLPQINAGFIYQRNFDLPVSLIRGELLQIGIDNTSTASFGLTQTIFNREVLLASRTAKDLRRQAVQNIADVKIDLVADVSKAFYNVLLNLQQIQVILQNIQLLERSQKDAYYQYEAGIVDKIDYKRATIALNNSRAQLKNAQENVNSTRALLRQLLSYPEERPLDLIYDTLRMKEDIFMDTLSRPVIENRIEFQLLQTQRRLQEANLRYQKWGFIPSLSAFGNYNFNWQNNEFGKLYNREFPISNAGLTLAWPLFTGGRRFYQIRQAEWQVKRIDYDIVNLRNGVNTEYANAIAAYKSNLAAYFSARENLELASEVYGVIQLQYRSGIKTYLEVITAQSDLFNSQINFYNALYQLMISKVDVDRALGRIKYEYNE